MESGSWVLGADPGGSLWVWGDAGNSDLPLCPWGQRFGHAVIVALYAPSEPVMDYNMVIIFVMAVGTVALGGYWAGSRDGKR